MVLLTLMLSQFHYKNNAWVLYMDPQNNKHIVPLYLSTLQITPLTDISNFGFTSVVDTPTGNINTFKTNITWKNIDMKTLLGRYWDDYDYFSLDLAQFMTYTTYPTGSIVFGNNSGVFPQNRPIIMYISGLDWINCNHGIVNQCNRAHASLGSIGDKAFRIDNNSILTTTAGWNNGGANASYIYSETSCYDNRLIFKKSTSTVNLNIVFNFVYETNINMVSPGNQFDTAPQRAMYHFACKLNFKPLTKEEAFNRNVIKKLV